jgi:hypothetical protein
MNPTTTFVYGAMYNLMAVSNTSLSIGTPTVSGAYQIGSGTAMQLLATEAWAQNQQFILNATGQVVLGVDATNRGLATPGSCATGQQLQLETILAVVPNRQEFVYNSTTMLLANCNGAFCIQANNITLGSGLIIAACNSSNPLQQWLLGVSMGV